MEERSRIEQGLAAEANDRSNPMAAQPCADAPSQSDDHPTVISSKPPEQPGSMDAIAELLQGHRLAHFELIGSIGVGGMAAVLKARDTQLDRIVALKVLPPEMAADSENVRRFQHEARAAAKLDHENIARVYFCGEEQGLHFIAFEHVEGENLRSVLSARLYFQTNEALEIALQIARGLCHAAERGVVHRDIKPSNIILSPSGIAKLVDMGLARSIQPHHDGELTQSGVTLGTFDYISPEQALDPRAADVRSDIYSLGCTLYHMLTGKSPVPEGTAARKLHYHQSVAPPDPRQLNANIPEPVVAVLSRMMAKNPGDRYQSPRLLVEDLSVLLEHGAKTGSRLGSIYLHAGADLGSPPKRIFVLAGSALLLIALALAFIQTDGIDPGTDSLPGKQTESNWLPQQPTSQSQPVALSQPPEAARPNNDDEPFRPPDAKSLRAYLQERHTAHVQIHEDLALSPGDLLHFSGKSLIFEGLPGPGLRLPTIRLSYDFSTEPRSWTILTVKSGSVVIRNLRFELQAKQADLAMTSVCRLGGDVRIEDCQFAQIDPAAHLGRIRHILVGGAPSEHTPVICKGSYFSGGQSAVTLEGSASATFSQCAFAPHQSAVFEARHDLSLARPRATFQVEHCTLLLSGAPAFRVRDAMLCAVGLQDSVVAEVSAGEDRGILFEQVNTGRDALEYRGGRNLFMQLAYLWSKSSDGRAQDRAANLESLRDSLAVCQDSRSLELKRDLWESQDLLADLRADRVQHALRLQSDWLIQRAQRDGLEVVGAERGTFGDLYRELRPQLARRDQQIAAGERIVDPDIPAIGNNRYRTLRQALDDVQPGDVILIKKQGLLPVDPVSLDRSGLDVTIRPFPGYKPILTLGRTVDPDAAMFKLHDGTLKLEQLDFSLLPSRTEFKAQAIIALAGDGSCLFKDCIVTLQETKDTPLSLVSLLDSAQVMRMDGHPIGGVPRIHFEACLVRGAGDLMTVRSSRPFDLRLEQSLLVMDGSFLVIDGSTREQAGRSVAEVVLRQSTTYLTESLICLRGQRDESLGSRGLVLTQVRATDCVFVAAQRRPLVHTEAIESDEQLKRAFSWADGRHNLYSNFPQYLEQQIKSDGNETLQPMPLGKGRWEELTQDVGSRYERSRVIQLPAPDGPFVRVTPSDCKLRTEPAQPGLGADIDRLRMPVDEDRVSP